MSKSLGNVVNPHEMAERYTADAFRYFLLREVPFGSDGDFSEKALLGRYNSELANNLGNLMQRTSTLLLKHFDGAIPNLKSPSQLIENPKALWEEIEKAYDGLQFGDILETAYGIMVKTTNTSMNRPPGNLEKTKKSRSKKFFMNA
jgi:methionyl-tRNA synthetase